jgi:hypothetical protein
MTHTNPQHISPKKLVEITAKNARFDTHFDTQYWQFLNCRIQTDTPSVISKKNHFSYFFSVLFTRKKSDLLQFGNMAEKVGTAYWLNYYLLTVKTAIL